MARILVTGGAGFVGSTVVRALIARGDEVVVWDDLSRIGSADRLAALSTLEQAEQIHFRRVDVSRWDEVEGAARADGPWDAVLHLAAQVAVTWSMQDPRHDFLVNALGAFHVIDAVRRRSPTARCVHISSNKVFGDLADLAVVRAGDRHVFRDLPAGVPASRPLDPVTPYGVSKAAGESAFRDAARTHGLDVVVLRCSCIYGPRQSRQEDQGWVSWFAHAVAQGLPIRIFGDGLTTRDLLWVDDLVDLLLRILDAPTPPRGLTLAVGGGDSAARSLLEVVHTLEASVGRSAIMSFHPERPADQRVFITDTSLAQDVYGWVPRCAPEEGLPALLQLSP